MSNIVIKELNDLSQKYIETLDEQEAGLIVVGGRRRKVKIDLDGDGKWDIKIVVRD